MSRTVRRNKVLSYEYWSRRPGNKHGGTVGKFTKTKTCRIERRIAKELVRKEVTDDNT